MTLGSFEDGRFGDGPFAGAPDGPSDPDGTERVAPPAVRPRDALLAAGTAAVATGALVAGAEVGVDAYAGAVLGVQLALVAAWCLTVRRVAVGASAVVGVVAALGADAAALWAPRASAAPLVGVVAGAFVLAVLAQLARRSGRAALTEAFSASLTAAVAGVALAATISLHRQGDVAILVAYLLAAGAGVLVARVTDLVVPRPPVHEAVARGLPGLAAGGLLGAAAATVFAAVDGSLSVPLTAVVGWVAATAAVLGDLAVAYAGAGRALDGDAPPRSAARAVLGALLGLAVAAPAGYVFGLVLLS